MYYDNLHLPSVQFSAEMLTSDLSMDPIYHLVGSRSAGTRRGEPSVISPGAVLMLMLPADS